MKRFVAETAVMLLIAFATIMIVGPTAGANSMAFKIAMRIYTGV